MPVSSGMEVRSLLLSRDDHSIGPSLNTEVPVAVDLSRRSLIGTTLLSLGAPALLAACGGGENPPLGQASALGSSQVTIAPQPLAAAPAPAPAPAPATAPAPAPAPPAPSGKLPSWVPAPGEVSRLTQASGKLTNTFISVCSDYFSPFYLAKICNDYSGAFHNPHFGAYGAIIFWGGGHAATNDNSVVALVLGETNCTFHRVTDPTPYFGGGKGDIERNTLTSGTGRDDPITGVLIDAERLKYAEGPDGQPLCPHSYGSGDVIGPADGGAAFGTFIQVSSVAAAFSGQGASVSAHKIDFDDLNGYADGASPTYAWQRVTNNRGSVGYGNDAMVGIVSAPGLSAYVSSQNRVYYEARSSRSPRWFDVSARTYAAGTGAARSAFSSSDSGAMFHVPSRNLVLYLDYDSGSLCIQYMDVTASNPSWVSGVTLTSAIGVPSTWTAGCWCADNNRIIVGNASGEADAVYEIEIPATLTQPWPVTRAPFVRGSIATWLPTSVWKKWGYNPKIKSIVYVAQADSSGRADTVYVYRPRGT